MDRQTWLQTYGGDGPDGAIDLFEPKPGQYTIEAIAHSLALTNRFRGMTHYPFSVAQHCVLGSRTLSDPGLALSFLLHELDEVVTGDILPGIKAALSICHDGWPEADSFSKFVTRHVRAAARDLALPASFFPHCRAVKDTDLRMLATEKRDLLGKSPRDWYLTAVPFPETIRAWGWRQSEDAFLRTYFRLRDTLATAAGQEVSP